MTAVTKLISADLIAAVLAPVLQLLGHPRELVRKKAVAVLQRFEQLDPAHDGPLSGADVDAHLRRMLCDKARPLARPSARRPCPQFLEIDADGTRKVER